mgnify:CR=1 FL=1
MRYFSSSELLFEEQNLKLPDLTTLDAIKIGLLATDLGNQRKLPIAIEVRIGDWIVYHASLEGSKPENDWWINRKVAVVVLNQHSTMFERVSAEERGVDWHKENGVADETHAIELAGLFFKSPDQQHVTVKGFQLFRRNIRRGSFGTRFLGSHRAVLPLARTRTHHIWFNVKLYTLSLLSREHDQIIPCNVT